MVVYNYPYDAPNSHVCDALEFFGKIQEIRFQRWTNLPEVATGTRIVRINLRRRIPRFVMINSYRCKVWYRGQPTYCDICKEGTHIASGCPFKGKCLSCKGIGHLARKCPNVCFSCKGAHASDSCPNSRRWEQSRRDDDDFHSVASDVVAADEIDPDVSASAANGVDADVPAAYGEEGVASASGRASQRVVLYDFLAPPSSHVVEGSTVGDQASDSSSLTIDERFNQLDELVSPSGSDGSQSDVPRSQSTLASVTSEGQSDVPRSLSVLASATGEGQSAVPQSQSVPVSVSQEVREACEALEVSGSPAVLSSAEVVPSPDVQMVAPSGARKRVVDEMASSDETVSSAGSSRSRPRVRAPKSSRIPTPHMPAGVSSAASLARSRSSSLSKSCSRKSDGLLRLFVPDCLSLQSKFPVFLSCPNSQFVQITLSLCI